MKVLKLIKNRPGRMENYKKLKFQYQKYAFNYLHRASEEKMKPILHFGHANGIPPYTYKPLFEKLAPDFDLYAADFTCRENQDFFYSGNLWLKLTTLLTDFLLTLTTFGIVGVGHSLGAVITLLGANRKPELFKKLVLIDPAVIPKPDLYFWKIVQLFRFSKYLPLATKTRKKRDIFTSTKEMYDLYKEKPIFKSWLEECFNLYIDNSLIQENDYYTLLRPKEVEAKLFEQTPHFLLEEFERISMPAVLVLGELSPYYTPKLVKQILKLNHKIDIRIISGAGHFIPMENPELISQIVLEEK